MSIFDKIKNYLFCYTFVERIAEGQSYSTNFKIRKNLDGSIWAGKIARPLPDIVKNFNNRGTPYIRTVDFRDQNSRAILGFRLAKLVGLQTLKTKVIDADLIKGLDISTISRPKIDNKIFLSEFKGQALTDYLRSRAFKSFESSDIQNKDEATKCYDNKDRDYLVDENKKLISIDYHLLGPGFQDNIKLAVGAYGESFDINDPRDTGWCIGDGFLLGYLKNSTYDWETFQNEINRINTIKQSKIERSMSGLNFYIQGTNININKAFLNFLFERRPKLESTIKQWFSAGCPLASLPKENGVE